MNAILGFAQILEYDPELDERQKDSVQEILGAGRHLLELINEVLDLSRIESGQLNLSISPVPLAELADECIALIAPIAEMHALKFTAGDFTGLLVRADRLRLKQVLLNLLSNAVKYNREGGSIHFDARAQGELVTIQVTDTGKGLDSQQQAQLFQPFNRLGAEGSNIEGTGIGLTITKRLVEMMAGEIELRSEAGEGSTFVVILPRAGSENLVAAKNAEVVALPVASQDEGRKQVLYIEDNPANLKLVSQLLARRANIHLRTAFEPALGIELARLQTPDLILLDISLPGMNGYQLLKIFQEDESLRHVPVVAVTANAMPEDVERGRRAGFTDYLVKPLDVGDFYRMLDRVLFTGVVPVVDVNNVSAK